MDQSWLSFKFITRARAIFWARMFILMLFLVVFLVKDWASFLGMRGPWALLFYICILLYTSVFAYSIFYRKKEMAITYISLFMDLPFIVYLIIYTGGLRSPLFFLQLLYTTFFALLFIRPLQIVPPLMLLPIISHIDQLVFVRGLVVQDVLLLIMYALANLLLLYSIVYLNTQENLQHEEILRLKDAMKELELSDERLRLSREIHDGIGATLSAIIMQIDYILSLSEPEVIKKEIEEMRGISEEGMEELRRAVALLRSDLDLKNMLSNMVERFESRTGCRVESNVVLTDCSMKPDELLAIFRIIQEALTNAAKHAVAQCVRLYVKVNGKSFEILVQDNGKGFDPDRPYENHYGIINMKERARLIGAILNIESAPNSGTKVLLKRGN